VNELARVRALGRDRSHAGGYDWRERATAVPRGLGFSDDHLDRKLETFSGGELTRKSRRLGFEFLKPARSGRTVVEATGLELRIGERVLLVDATFAIERGGTKGRP